MPPRILDEESLKAREQTIIDATIVLIGEYGVENITMDKVVASVPYSKGTVYKHFLGKEDLFLAIGNQAVAIMVDLFGRAAKHEGSSRERMLLLSISYLIYAILHPSLFKTVMCTKSPSVYNKSSEKNLAKQAKLDDVLLTTIHSIVEQAVKSGEFFLPQGMSVHQICFTAWSAAYGTISLLSADVDSCKGRAGLMVDREVFNQTNVILDGFQWAPFTADKNYTEAMTSAVKKVFPGELALMKSKGRELSFM